MSKMTIKDIANQAGVSVATVSRVLNGTGNVNAEIKSHVQKVIQENNYSPSVSARSLKSEQTLTIGLILSDISDWYFSLMTKAIAETLYLENYSLIVCSTDHRPEKEKWYFDFLSSKQVDGIILNTAGGLDSDICNLSHRIPLALVNRRVNISSSMNSNMDFIGSDDSADASMMVQYLYKKGHHKIGIINGNLSVSSGQGRYQGFVKTMGLNGIKVDESYPYRFDGQFDENTGYQGIHYLLGQQPSPSAILTMNDSITIGALKYCRSHAIDIPKDISLVAYGEINNAELFAVTPTYISLDPTVTGRKAAQCILERIRNPQCVNREIFFTPTLVEGGSIRQFS